MRIDRIFTTRREAAEYIDECEKKYENTLRLAARDALSRGNRVIALSGPTCSGKTTTSRLLSEEIEEAGYRAIVFSIDDFYRNDIRAATPDGEVPDFDSVSTIDLPYFEKFTSALFAGKQVEVPIFDFVSGRRRGYREYVPRDKDIFIFEGIQALYPEISVSLGGEHTTMFVCVEESVDVGTKSFSADEIRLFRRTVRDCLFRNARPEFTLRCWQAVRDNERRNIFPNVPHDAIRINSLLGYEIFMLAAYAGALFSTVPESDVCSDQAAEYSSRLSALQGKELFEISDIPKDSMFREFIGSNADASRLGII